MSWLAASFFTLVFHIYRRVSCAAAIDGREAIAVFANLRVAASEFDMPTNRVSTETHVCNSVDLTPPRAASEHEKVTRLS